MMEFHSASCKDSALEKLVHAASPHVSCQLGYQAQSRTALTSLHTPHVRDSKIAVVMLTKEAYRRVLAQFSRGLSNI